MRLNEVKPKNKHVSRLVGSANRKSTQNSTGLRKYLTQSLRIVEVGCHSFTVHHVGTQAMTDKLDQNGGNKFPLLMAISRRYLRCLKINKDVIRQRLLFSLYMGFIYFGASPTRLVQYFMVAYFGPSIR